MASVKQSAHTINVAGHVAKTIVPKPIALAPAIQSKPAPLAGAAFHGIAGEFVRLVEPHTEADPAALLIQFLVAAGIFLGRSVFYLAEADRHYCNLFAVIVGNTSKGRKGTSWGQVKRLIGQANEGFLANCVTSGISSGEGLIWRVRDPIVEQQAIKEKGRVVGYEDVVVDGGVADKRLLIQEPEFARVLKNCGRESNSASAVIREAWDSGTLNTLTKTQKAVATASHIGIIGHITSEELNRLLNNTEAANGFANRFLWVYAERSKELPFGGNLDESELAPLASKLGNARSWCQTGGRIDFDSNAAADWERLYGPLSAGKPGLLGAAIGRAEAQVVRAATLFAALDQSHVIRRCHLEAAMAVWDYAEASAGYIFGESLGDDTADSLLAFLRSVGPAGASRTELSGLFGRNKSSGEITRALTVLSNSGLAVSRRDTQTGGAHAERWFMRSVAAA